MTAGTGAKPVLTDRVKIHYQGTLTDGTVFDSSLGKDPVEFPVGGVIKGFTSALLEMPVGSKWKVTIPSDLAYGKRVLQAQKSALIQFWFSRLSCLKSWQRMTTSLLNRNRYSKDQPLELVFFLVGMKNAALRKLVKRLKISFEEIYLRSFSTFTTVQEGEEAQDADRAGSGTARLATETIQF